MKLSQLVGAVAGMTWVCIAAGQEASSAEAEAPPKSFAEAVERAGVKLVKGPAMVPLGKVAELKLPEGFHFVGADGLDKFYELTRNSKGGNEVGVVISPKEWMLFLSYSDIGYVKDNDRDQLEAAKLLKSLQESQDADNEERQKRGWDRMKVVDWATAPHYDAKTNNLKWAINLASSRDSFKEVWINESVRILGRGGVMNATLVTEPAAFKEAETEADALLAGNFSYRAGEKYAEFKAGDKVAEYGLAALVLGGAGAVAVKTGLFAAIASFFGKMWKALVLVVIAGASALGKLWGKIRGDRPPPADEVK